MASSAPPGGDPAAASRLPFFEPEPTAVEAEGASSLAQRFFHWLVPNLTAFIASFCIMVLELVAGRIVARYLGSSLYTWTSVIGIVLGGITIGNLLGGRLADWFRPRAVLAVLFLLASGACVSVPLLNDMVDDGINWSPKADQASWFVRSVHRLSGGESPEGEAETLQVPWSGRVFSHVLLVFLLPSTLLGTIGPVVAKMALERSRRIGRTVGNVYAWGALGSIVGTFITGFYLISKIGTEAVVWSVGGTLGLMGLLFCLSLLWSASRPVEALIAFFSVFWALGIPVLAVLWGFQSWGTFKGKGWHWQWVERDGRWVLREKPKEGRDIVYLDESDYSFIKVELVMEDAEKGDEPKELRRELVLDNLIHAYYVPGKVQELEYDYEEIYKAITHRFAPPEAREREGLKALFIGGGGYIFPRYLRSAWPESYIEIAEIDPAVTRAVLAEFGLEKDGVQIVKTLADRKRKDNPIWIYHLDARNHVEDLVRRKAAGEPVPEFDFIYGDAFNDYTVPFHLTTEEFNRKVMRLLKPGTGVYMINIIDIFNPGQFLGAVYNTFRETFGDNVYVFGCNEGKPSDDRDTYIVVGALRPLELSDLPGKEEPYNFTGTLLLEEHLATLTDAEHAGSLKLTDNFAPVENLLRNVVNRRKW